MEKFEIDTSIKNFDVYNALNLIQEDLGEIYKQNDFNPFEQGFKLSEEFVVDRIENGKQKKEVLTPTFLNGTKQTLSAFSASADNALAIISLLDEKISAPSTPASVKEELKKIKALLACRIELINYYKTNFKKKKNDLKMYTNVLAVDWKTADLYEETFKDQFDVQIAVNAFLEFAKTNSKTYKKEMTDQKLIQRAKEIIKNNQLAQSKEQQKQSVTAKTVNSTIKEQSELKTEIKSQPSKEQQKPSLTKNKNSEMSR